MDRSPGSAAVRQFPAAHASGADAEAVVRTCIAGLRDAAGANLGFVYVSDVLAGELERIVERLRGATGVERWLGTVGSGICGGEREYYDEPAAAVMLGDFAQDRLHVLAGTARDAALRAALDWGGERPGCFALLHLDPTDVAGGESLAHVVRALESGFVAGGLSSARTRHAQVAGGPATSGLSGALFDPAVAVVVDHTQGCTPIGPRHRITACERNIVVSLDGRPALDVLREDAGEVIARDLRRAAGFIFAALAVPGSDTGDYMVRNLIGVDSQRGLIALGERLETNSELMFCRRDGNSAREDLTRMTERLRRRLQGRPIRGGIYVSCIARGRNQFGDRSEEVRAIQDALGPFPMAGFFASGELYNGRLYGYTGVLTLFL